MRRRRWAAAAVFSAVVAGCVVVVHPDDDERIWESEWEARESPAKRGHSAAARGSGVADAVVRSYLDDALLGEADILVTVRDDIASLHGRVPSRAHFERAVQLALSTPGVAAVESRLTVTIAGPVSEEEE